ncbi:MAG: phosphotransferase [Pseudomonadota bacterium]
MSAIPASIEEVTADWLTSVLGAPVRAHEPTQIGQGVGVMGDIYRVRLDAEAALPESVVVKLPSSFPENREQGVALGMFEAEVRFYRELAPRVPAGLPAIHHADINPGSAEFVIVMEDLSELSMVDQVAGMSPAQAAAAVRLLATVHAEWWDAVTDGELDWIPTMNGPRIEFVDQLLPSLLEPFLDKFAHVLSDDARRLYRAFSTCYLKLGKALAAGSPWTLAHQDFRVDNLLFGDDSVMAIDWQGIGRGPGAYDLAYVLGGSVATATRRAHEGELLDAYFDTLRARGVRGYDRDALHEDYAHAQLMGGLATAMVVGGGMDLSNERGMRLIESMSRRHAAAALDHDGLARLAALD